ncbi:hypothetical protein M3Y98_00551300 [Aphelenchoides besseyi]|nr:hypothetical protein M3Y98_00551300 [Aphelenchoides besseyi]KAI6194104.1 hypothetical protein M3Y96_01089400 [Aphelenchoides besseyi]
MRATMTLKCTFLLLTVVAHTVTAQRYVFIPLHLRPRTYHDSWIDYAQMDGPEMIEIRTMDQPQLSERSKRKPMRLCGKNLTSYVVKLCESDICSGKRRKRNLKITDKCCKSTCTDDDLAVFCCGD